jgi:hypothetical protein
MTLTPSQMAHRERVLRHLESTMEDHNPELLKAAKNAAATIGAIYQWVEQIEALGGATSMAGIAKCHAMLKSLRKNAQRTDELVMRPVREAIAKAEGRSP